MTLCIVDSHARFIQYILFFSLRYMEFSSKRANKFEREESTESIDSHPVVERCFAIILIY